MIELFTSPEHWQAQGIGAAGFASFLWGLGTAIVSPCHLGIIPLLTSRAAGVGPLGDGGAQTPRRALADVLLFALGYYATIPLFGLVIAFFGTGLFGGSHLWTIPAGALLLWFGVSMMRGHSCSSISHIMQTMSHWFGLGPHSGIMALGFGYGILSGGCSAGFLVPVMMASLTQGVAVSVWLAACFGAGHCTPMVIVGTSAPLAAKAMAHHRHHVGCHGDHDHTEHGVSCQHHDPHRIEKAVRTVLGILMAVAGILLALHPFLEHHH